MKKRSIFAAAAAVAVFATAAVAATEFPVFVGKGGVQLALGMNNNQLQQQADALQFAITTVEETSWECVNTNNDRINERNRTTTTSGVVSHTERVRNQITGFFLTGFSGSQEISTDGPALNSCPSGPWQYVEDSTVTEPGEGGGITVNGVPLN